MALPSLIDRGLTAANPLRSVAKIQQNMDRLFDRMWSDVGMGDFEIPSSNFAFVPACNVDETDNYFLMSFDIPGVKKEDLKINLRGHTLMVSGERKDELEQKGKTKFQVESNYGVFQRTFELAEDVIASQIEAQYENGVLRVAVPKTKATKTENIKIVEGRGDNWGKLISPH